MRRFFAWKQECHVWLVLLLLAMIGLALGAQHATPRSFSCAEYSRGIGGVY